jgi:hypothetical protein
MKPLFVETQVMFRVLVATSLSVTALTLTSLGALAQPAAMVETINLGEVETAQEAWCDALVAISRAHAKGVLDQSKSLAGQVIDGAYGYQYGPVAFKPTWANGETTFRKTSAGAVSYFVGDNAAFDDLGFAIGTPGPKRSPWVICRPEIAVIQIFSYTANAMWWVHIEAADRTRSKVDKTFGYVRDDDGTLRIVVHHSSSPFSGY